MINSNDNTNSNVVALSSASQTDVFANLALALADETGIDTASAGKVVTWLINEGVLDAPVVAEEFNNEAVGA